MRIKDMMSHPAVTCLSSDTLDIAARLMWEYDCGVIPVVSDDGRLNGIVTDRDICMAAYTQGRPLHLIPVASAMAHHPVACHGGDTIEAAEGLMRDNQIRRLPVLDDNGRPVGVVSMNDLARLASRSKRSGVDREFVETLAATCQPRGHASLEAPQGAALVAKSH